jgi:hypothetical protein
MDPLPSIGAKDLVSPARIRDTFAIDRRLSTLIVARIMGGLPLPIPRRPYPPLRIN